MKRENFIWIVSFALILLAASVHRVEFSHFDSTVDIEWTEESFQEEQMSFEEFSASTFHISPLIYLPARNESGICRYQLGIETPPPEGLLL